jgi:terminase large subunit-like protein
VTGRATTLDLPLRPYQAEARRAVLESVHAGAGRSFSVEIARQGGKNELSAHIELELLLRYRDADVFLIKAAPTFHPQAKISMDRLWDRVLDAGLRRWASRDANSVRLGRARQLFLSAETGSNVVGHTADLLLEIDEAQDVDPDKFDKDFAPMAAARAATTVFYGTAWDDAGLLERVKQSHLAQERRDGIRRHFEYDWRVVARSNPAYATYVSEQRESLGEEHPMFQTQYCLRTLPGAGRFLGPAQLTLLRGAHPRLDSPVAGETYVGGLDVAGEAAEAASAAGHDATVLTVARVIEGERAPNIEVVAHYAWTGVVHGALQSSIAALAQEWRLRRLVVDATGIGEPVASMLAASLGSARVQALKLTADSKSSLGYALLAAVNAGRLRLHAGRDTDAVESRRQLEHCRAVYRPNQMLRFFVDERDGHDDYVISLALVVAAAGTSGPRRARGRAAATEA